MEIENSLLQYIYNNSTSSVVESIDENIFNKSFLTYFNDPYIINLLNNALKTGTRIGAPSGFGQAIITDDVNPVVIKRIDICGNYASQLPFQKGLCDMAKAGDLIFYIENTVYHKTIVLAPNHIAELLMALILSSEKVQIYTPNFVRTQGVQYVNDKISPHYYQVMEPLVGLYETLTSTHHIQWYLFQMMWALSKSQELLRYTHFDLHGENIMARRLSDDGSVLSVYELDDGTYMLYRNNFDNVIIDYGFNRLETPRHVITGRSLFNANDPNRNDYFEYYNFNPFVDMFTAIYSTLLVVPANKLADGNVNMSANKVLMMRTLGISALEKFFKMTDNNGSLFKYIQTTILLSPYHWRPKPEVFYTQDNLPLTPKELLKTFADTADYFNMDDKSLAKESKKYIIKIQKCDNKNFSKRFVGIDNIKEVKFYPKVPESSKMDITQYPIRSISDPSTPQYMANNYITITTFEISGIVFHVSIVDQIALLKSGYKWEFDCCRIVIQDILRNPKIKAGMVINSSFFRIKDNFEPIGRFKTRELILDNPVPDVYKDYYGIIRVDGTTNMLSILSENEFSTVKNDDKTQYVSVGPIIVDNSLKTADDYCNIVDKHNVQIFNCRQPVNGETNAAKIFGDGMPNCNRIEPGEFKHGCQKNPRSALFITSNDMIGLVYVEGRNERGVGATFHDLAEICQKMGAKRAINLDGGRSSQLLWRDENVPIINQLNPTHNFVYPVGATIGIIKR